MRPFGVIPFDPLSNGGAGFGEAGEVMLPDAFFFEAAKEALDEAVLFGHVGRDELLRQTVIAAGGAKTPALKNQSIVAAYHRRRTLRTQGAKVRVKQASSSARSASLARPRKANGVDPFWWTVLGIKGRRSFPCLIWMARNR